MTIRTWVLLLSYAGVAVVALSIAHFYRLSMLNRAYSAENIAVAQVNDMVHSIDLLAYEYLLYREPRAHRQLVQQCQQLQASITTLTATGHYIERSIASELRRSQDMLELLAPVQSLSAPQAALQAASPSTTVSVLSPDIEPTPRARRSRYLGEQLLISSQKMFADASLWQLNTQTARNRLLREATLSGLIASSILLVILIVGSVLLLRTIVVPVERLRRAVAAVTTGDLNHHVPVDRKDELGKLASGFNQMTNALALAELQRQRSSELESRGEALERMNRDLEYFAAMASHDLQAPLRTITNFSELIQRRAGTQMDKRSKAHLERIIQASERMRSLIESLLRFSRAGSIDVSHDQDLSCRAALDQALENLSRQLHDVDHELIIEALPTVHFDGIQLIQVFQNLISNAVTYRDPSRQLRVYIRMVTGSYPAHTIVVSDNGPGIDPQQHTRIFGMFHRAHASDIAGSGIGLALCRKIIEQRAGTIWVESTLGHGAAFFFTLPPARSQPAKTT